MAKGKKTGGRNFQKGISGNPKGRPRLEFDALRLLSYDEVLKTLSEFLLMTHCEMENSLVSPSATLTQKLIGGIFNKAIEKCCYRRTQLLLKYVLGGSKPI